MLEPDCLCECDAKVSAQDRHRTPQFRRVTPLNLRISQLGKKAVSALARTAAEDLFPESPDRRMRSRPTISLPARILNCSGRQRGQLPIQIPISVALDWHSGWNSPAANADRSKPLRGDLLCFRAQTEALKVLQAHNTQSEFARRLTLKNSVLKPHTRGFARNLRCSNIPVNEKNRVLLLTVEGAGVHVVSAGRRRHSVHSEEQRSAR
jgi:hypothetical protein